jgi:serine/threonine protein kinase
LRAIVGLTRLLDLKPENLIYVTKDLESDLVLADFGIAKTLGGQEDTLQTMAGSFGYAAPEVMDRKGHGKPVDMWSMGVITYTLLCGYSPFRSENLPDLLEECNSASVVFHERYWKDVSQDAKDFINCLIVPDPDKRWTSKVRHKTECLLLEIPLMDALTTSLASAEAQLAHRQDGYRPRLAARASQGPRGQSQAQARHSGCQPQEQDCAAQGRRDRFRERHGGGGGSCPYHRRACWATQDHPEREAQGRSRLS